MRVSATTQGFAKALQTVIDLEKKVVRKAVRKGMNDATKLVLSAAKAGVPEDTKTLRKALGRRVVTYRSAITGIVGARMDADGKPVKFSRKVRRGRSKKEKNAVPANYIHLVEMGTRPHAIGKGDKLFRKSKRGRQAGPELQRGPMHPGAKPNPFMLRAWLATEGAARQKIYDRVGLEILNMRLGGS